MKRKVCKVQVNGETFSAYRGDLLLDAALMNGVDIPHDCRSGVCGTCRVRVVEGHVFGGQTSDPEAVQACQGRVMSDLTLLVEDTPEATTLAGRVAELTPLAPDVVGVGIELARPPRYFPGQYYKVQFRGFPPRCYSPTAPLDGPGDERLMRLHVRRLTNGRVSSALGRRIHRGHHVKVVGPLGSAYLRPDHQNRLVLVASGTGFAPIWSIAVAAIGERREREVVLVVGARRLESFYMIPALCRLARFRNTTIVPVLSEPQSVSSVLRQGQPIDHLPALTARDVVYAAGAPAMVERVAAAARMAGAKCYMDAFAPEAKEGDVSNLLNKAVDWFTERLR